MTTQYEPDLLRVAKHRAANAHERFLDADTLITRQDWADEHDFWTSKVTLLEHAQPAPLGVDERKWNDPEEADLDCYHIDS